MSRFTVGLTTDKLFCGVSCYKSNKKKRKHTKTWSCKVKNLQRINRYLNWYKNKIHVTPHPVLYCFLHFHDWLPSSCIRDFPITHIDACFTFSPYAIDSCGKLPLNLRHRKELWMPPSQRLFSLRICIHIIFTFDKWMCL